MYASLFLAVDDRVDLLASILFSRFDHPSVTAEIRKAYQNTPDSLKYSIRLDQALTGFKWDNPTFRRILDLYDKYHSL